MDVVDPVEVEMAVVFCLRMSQDTNAGPKQPWHLDGRLIMSADDKPIGEVIHPADGALIAGMLTGSAHINKTFHLLAKLLVDAGKEGWESNSGKRLKSIISRLMKMEVDGKLPRIG